jgi:hypothetical protein
VGYDGDPGAGGGSGAVELSEWAERAGFVYPARMRQPANKTSHHWTVFEPNAAIDPALLVRPGS